MQIIMKKTILLAAALIALTGCMEDKLYEGPNNIDKVTYTPQAPTSNDAVTVTATTSGLHAISSAKLTYNGTDVNMTGSGASFSGTIPALADGTEVNFTVTITNEIGYTTTSDRYSYTVGDPATDWTKLKLNEVYGAGDDNAKFFELYNGSDFPIKLTGVTIHKDEAICWTGIDGEVVPAKGFFAIVGAKGTTERGFSSGFSAKKSVIVELFDSAGNKLDTFQRGEKGTGWGNQSLTNNSGSWSRIPDGTGSWKVTETITSGAANATTGTDDETIVQ